MTDYVVFWIENGFAQFEPFTELVPTLNFTELLRKRAKNGAEIRHIVSSAENANSVGQKGVSEPSEDVAAFWSKRRYVGPVGRDPYNNPWKTP